MIELSGPLVFLLNLIVDLFVAWIDILTVLYDAVAGAINTVSGIVGHDLNLPDSVPIPLGFPPNQISRAEFVAVLRGKGGQQNTP